MYISILCDTISFVEGLNGLFNFVTKMHYIIWLDSGNDQEL